MNCNSKYNSNDAVIDMVSCIAMPDFALSLKRKCHHFDKIIVSGCNRNCHSDKFQYSDQNIVEMPKVPLQRLLDEPAASKNVTPNKY